MDNGGGEGGSRREETQARITPQDLTWGAGKRYEHDTLKYIVQLQSQSFPVI